MNNRGGKKDFKYAHHYVRLIFFQCRGFFSTFRDSVALHQFKCSCIQSEEKCLNIPAWVFPFKSDYSEIKL